MQRKILNIFIFPAKFSDIEEYISSHNCNVFYHGYVSKDSIYKELSSYDASLIPLSVNIKGAVPSKIYDTAPLGIPILLSADGECANIVKNFGLGLVSEPGNYKQLHENILKLSSLTSNEYIQFSSNCISKSKIYFNFSKQINILSDFITQI